MAPIGNENATKKFRNKNSALSSISMDLKWFMDDMPSYPPILFSFFVLRFFWSVCGNCGVLLLNKIHWD
jgi:hypothetical protein